MIHGFVGVGKTTFSKALQKKTNAVRFTPDEWMTQLYGSNPASELFADYEVRVLKMMWGLVEQTILAGTNVILDFGFWTPAERQESRARLESLGACIVLYNLRCEERTMFQRVMERTSEMSEGALFIDENALKEFRGRFQPVDPSRESCITVWTDRPDSNYPTNSL